MQTCRKSQPVPRLLLAAPVAGDAVADAVDPAELLDVDVDQLAGLLPLVADDRGLGVERREPAEPEAAQDQADGGDRPAELARNGRAGQALAAQRLDLGLGGIAQPGRAAMRPRRAVGQPGLAFLRDSGRATCATVLGVTPKAAATAVDRPARQRAAATISIRPLRRGSGILMDVHPAAPGCGLRAWQPQPSSSAPDGQPP